SAPPACKPTNSTKGSPSATKPSTSSNTSTPPAHKTTSATSSPNSSPGGASLPLSNFATALANSSALDATPAVHPHQPPSPPRRMPARGARKKATRAALLAVRPESGQHGIIGLITPVGAVLPAASYMRSRDVGYGDGVFRCEWHAKLERHRNRVHFTPSGAGA